MEVIVAVVEAVWEVDVEVTVEVEVMGGVEVDVEVDVEEPAGVEVGVGAGFAPGPPAGSPTGTAAPGCPSVGAGMGSSVVPVVTSVIWTSPAFGLSVFAAASGAAVVGGTVAVAGAVVALAPRSWWVRWAAVVSEALVALTGCAYSLTTVGPPVVGS